MKAVPMNESEGGFQELTGFSRIRGNRDLGGHAANPYAEAALNLIIDMFGGAGTSEGCDIFVIHVNGEATSDSKPFTKSGSNDGIRVLLGNSQTSYTYKNQELYDTEGNKYTGDDPFIKKTLSALNKINNSGVFGKLLLALLSLNENGVYIKDLKFRLEIIHPDVPFYDSQTNTIYMDYGYKGKYMTTAGYITRSPFLILAHELGHALSTRMGFYDDSRWSEDVVGDRIPKDEWFASYVENHIAFDSYEPLRTYYDDNNGKPNKETKLISNYQIGILKILSISIPYIKSWTPTNKPE